MRQERGSRACWLMRDFICIALLTFRDMDATTNHNFKQTQYNYNYIHNLKKRVFF